MFSPYGRSTLVKTSALCIAGLLLSLLLPVYATIPAAAASLLMLGFTLWFFRHPERHTPQQARGIIAPADGKILLIRPVTHPFTGDESSLISIFMSPFNVHVNRIPADGTVSRLSYHPGKFLMAFDHKSMTDNERMDIGISTADGNLLFSQVSGFLARRIVCSLDRGQNVRSGEPFGMIKFGSRLDITLPANTTIEVREGQKTRAGETVLGFFSPKKVC